MMFQSEAFVLVLPGWCFVGADRICNLPRALVKSASAYHLVNLNGFIIACIVSFSKVNKLYFFHLLIKEVMPLSGLLSVSSFSSNRRWTSCCISSIEGGNGLDQCRVMVLRTVNMHICGQIGTGWDLACPSCNAFGSEPNIYLLGCNGILTPSHFLCTAQLFTTFPLS